MGAQKKSGGPKKNFPALCAGNGPPTFNLLPMPLQCVVLPADTAVTYQHRPAIYYTASSAVTVGLQFPIRPAFAVRPDADHVRHPARQAHIIGQYVGCFLA